MPITFSCDQQLIVTTAEGVLSLEEILGHIAAKKSAGIMEYPEIVDVRGVTPTFSVNDLKRLASEVATLLEGAKPGKIAVVAHSALVQGRLHSYSLFAGSADLDFQVFPDMEEARAWLTA